MPFLTFRSVVLAATFSLASLAASAQTFGEFLSKPELQVTFMGADFSNARYYGPTLTVEPKEMKEQFTKINELLIREASKYDIQKALHRTSEVRYSTHIAESANQNIDPGTIVVPEGTAPRTAFTPQTVEGLLSHYTYPTDAAGIGLVLVVEGINKNKEQEIFWVTFVDLNTKQMLYTEKMGGIGYGFGFRNHWAHPFYTGLKDIKSRYGNWKKRFAKA